MRQAVFPNRSQAIERLERGRLARECAKMDVAQESALADEGLTGDVERWPEY